MTTDAHENTGTDRKAWKAPEVREVSPAKRTRGGSSFVNDQEDAWYTVS